MLHCSTNMMRYRCFSVPADTTNGTVSEKGSVEHLGVDVVVLQVDHVHLLADALQCGLRAQRRQVSAHIPAQSHSSSSCDEHDKLTMAALNQRSGLSYF